MSDLEQYGGSLREFMLNEADDSALRAANGRELTDDDLLLVVAWLRERGAKEVDAVPAVGSDRAQWVHVGEPGRYLVVPLDSLDSEGAE